MLICCWVRSDKRAREGDVCHIIITIIIIMTILHILMITLITNNTNATAWVLLSFIMSIIIVTQRRLDPSRAFYDPCSLYNRFIIR